MAKRGPKTKANMDALLSDAEEYIEKANPPIVAEYAHMHGIMRRSNCLCRKSSTTVPDIGIIQSCRCRRL